MSYRLNNLKAIYYTSKILFLLIVCLNVSVCCAQGLQFSSNDSLVTKRTSFHVFADNVPVFEDHFCIKFDLSLWDNSNLGYVFNIGNGNNSYSLSYIFDNNGGYLNFNIDRKSNKIKIPLASSLLKRKKWMKVNVYFDLKGDKVYVMVNNTAYYAVKMGFKDKAAANIIFGKNQYYTEVPNMAIKNLVIGNSDKSYAFPLNEWNGNQVHDANGNVTGYIENPNWLINESYFWKPVYQKQFKDVAGLNFNTNSQNLFIFSKDSLITYDAEQKRAVALPYKTPIPVPMVLGKSIYNSTENKNYIYELFDVPKGMPSVASLNMDTKNLTWATLGKAAMSTQLHHHNIFYDDKKDDFYLFGGYGSFKYHNDFLKYNRQTDKWDTVVFTGDKIAPRFFAATGNSDNPDELLLFGGYGNESGNQIVGGMHYYDLYRINLKNHSVKKCWSIKPKDDVFVPANNLILSPDKKYFYALCYPHETAKTTLRLYKIALKDGAYDVVSSPIPVTSERIESDDNLFYSQKSDEFFCTVQEFTDRKNSVIKIYSLTAPPVSSSSYAKSLVTKTNNNEIWYFGIAILGLAAVSVVVLTNKRKLKTNTVTEDLTETPIVAEHIAEKKAANAIYLLGEFAAFNKKGKNITYLFSPKIKQLFLLILLNNHKGLVSKRISAILWPDKDVNKTKNIKGVTFNHLRNIIADIDGIELVFLNDTYSYQVTEAFFCDYTFLTDCIEKTGTAPEICIQEHFDLIQRGPLLADMQDSWLDDFKEAYEELLIAILIPSLKVQYEQSNLKQSLELSKLILQMSPFNDEALKYELKIYKKLKGVDYAHKVYDSFVVDYKRSLGSDYTISFEQLIN
jgi:two-component SAPR family response regulator